MKLPTPLKKFQHEYHLQDQGDTAAAFQQLMNAGEGVVGICSKADELLSKFDAFYLTVNEEGNYCYTLPKGADACYNIQYVFEEGEECDIFLQEQNVSNMFTKKHPLYLVPLWNGPTITSKNKPKYIYLNWIFLRCDVRHGLYTYDFTTVNAYFTAFYYHGFLTLYRNEQLNELNIIAKRIQRCFLNFSERKRYLTACRQSIQRELIYLPPWGPFPGGIIYQNAKMSFNTLKENINPKE